MRGQGKREQKRARRRGVGLLAACGLILLLSSGCSSKLPGFPVVQDDRPPTVIIARPPSGVRVRAGQVVEIQSTATDDHGVVRVELFVDGERVRTDAPPEQLPQLSYSLVQRWRPEKAGNVTVKVIAYDTAGQSSPPAAITVEVIGAPASPTVTVSPSPAPSPVAPTPTASQKPLISGTVAVRALNVRAGPGTAFPVVEHLRLGDSVMALARTSQGDWVQVRLSDGRTGWVATRYLEWSGNIGTLPVWQPGE